MPRRVRVRRLGDAPGRRCGPRVRSAHATGRGVIDPDRGGSPHLRTADGQCCRSWGRPRRCPGRPRSGRREHRFGRLWFVPTTPRAGAVIRPMKRTERHGTAEGATTIARVEVHRPRQPDHPGRVRPPSCGRRGRTTAATVDVMHFVDRVTSAVCSPSSPTRSTRSPPSSTSTRRRRGGGGIAAVATKGAPARAPPRDQQTSRPHDPRPERSRRPRRRVAPAPLDRAALVRQGCARSADGGRSVPRDDGADAASVASPGQRPAVPPLRRGRPSRTWSTTWTSYLADRRVTWSLPGARPAHPRPPRRSCDAPAADGRRDARRIQIVHQSLGVTVSDVERGRVNLRSRRLHSDGVLGLSG